MSCNSTNRYTYSNQTFLFQMSCILKGRGKCGEVHIKRREPGSSVSIVSGYGTGRPGNPGLIPGRGKGFFL
jgi:hypothetical protein